MKKEELDEKIEELIEDGEIPDEEAVMGDIFDLYGESIKNHGPIGELTEENYLADLNQEEEKFTREQMKLSNIVRRYIIDAKEANIAAHAIMIDANVVTSQSRARGGKIIKAILEHGRTNITMPAPEKKSGISRFFGKKETTRNE